MSRRAGLRLAAALGVSVLLIVLMIRIFRPVKASELIGTYRHTYSASGLGVETIILKADQTFDQVFVKGGGARVTHTGKWLLQKPNTLILDDYLFITDPAEETMERQPEKGEWQLIVYRSLTGQVRSLEWGDEDAFAFDRVSN